MSKNEPISVEKLLQQRENKDNELAKPKFLSKKERARLALERRQEQVKNNAELPKPSLLNRSSSAIDPISSNAMDSDYPTIKKQRLETNQKYKFDWDEEDDTSNEYKPMILRDFRNNNITSHLSKKIDWNDRHWTDKPLDKMKERDWRILKEDFNISSKGGNIDNPLRSWEESSIPKAILKAIDKIGYKEPTPIQRAAIPVALNNRDVVGIAETGSGKTASFLIPLLTYILNLPPLNEFNRDDGPYALVIAPTRELAQQIEKECWKFCKSLGLRVTSIIGGHSFEETVHNISDGIHIVIATPGRLVDTLERSIMRLNQCYYLVMDEADRMIDMGFEIQVNKILESLPDVDYNTFGLAKRQTMMFTATMPPSIEKITKKYLVKPGFLIIGNVGDAVDTVVQEVEFLKTDDMRFNRMVDIINSRQFRPPVIIFSNYKKTCELISTRLTANGISNVIMHGSKNQEQRELALHQLKSGEVSVLVATDLAGRGIDIANVSLVLNFQMSKNIEDYTHRIGRTGRAGKMGHSITFLSDDDKDVLYSLKTMISRSPVSRLSKELRNHDAARIKTVDQ